jgi:hypothetical protein
VNGKKIAPINFDGDWCYPPNLFPTKFTGQIPIENRTAEVEILSGLINHPGDPDNSYGVFLYCNGRLIARGLTDFSVGFLSGLVGNPHYNISLVRTIVTLKGQSRDMPWDSSKSRINSKLVVFQAVRQSIIDATKRFAQVSRSLQGKWDADVFPHDTGHVVAEKLDTLASIPKSYLPTPPASKQKWHQKVLAANAPIVSAKPWAGGSLDSIIAVDLVFKHHTLAQKNRVSLIILDSTLEIAYKDYLVNEQHFGATAFKKICENRSDVQREVLKSLTISAHVAAKIEYYYKLRCDLIHQRATPNITDGQIEDYRLIVEGVLQQMFGLSFS